MTKALRCFTLALAAVLAMPLGAAAQPLTITITKGVEAGIPIAVVPFSFAGTGTPPHQVSDVVEADLVRSGRFDSVPRDDFLSRPTDDSEVRFKDWRLLKIEALVVGKVEQAGDDQYNVQFQLFDVFKGQQLTGRLYRNVPADRLRRTAHQIGDLVYELLTGEKGAFNTRIAYVTLERPAPREERFRLVVSDADGFDPRTILESTSPIMSPAWSPDGEHLAYVSFEDRNSNVYTQRLRDGEREKIAAFSGINSAPAWSPDGTRLALTLSRDGNAEIYVMNRTTQRLERLTRHLAIDTEPAWSPDGRSLVFTSDRSGSPQIYRMSADGGRPERLTFEGKYNARASFASDGESLALITSRDGGFKVATFHLRSRSLHVLTRTRLDESPTYAPNGAMILYGTESSRGRGVLAAVSSDGRVQQTLTTEQGDVREPAWSPYNPNQ